jgi:hypothetical protein
MNIYSQLQSDSLYLNEHGVTLTFKDEMKTALYNESVRTVL